MSCGFKKAKCCFYSVIIWICPNKQQCPSITHIFRVLPCLSNPQRSHMVDCVVPRPAVGLATTGTSACWELALSLVWTKWWGKKKKIFLYADLTHPSSHTVWEIIFIFAQEVQSVKQNLSCGTDSSKCFSSVYMGWRWAVVQRVLSSGQLNQRTSSWEYLLHEE